MKRYPLSHLESSGDAKMVDVSEKNKTQRSATAGCEVLMKSETLRLLRSGQLKKGDAFTVAKVAGMQAAKKTAELIPMCHPLQVEHVELRFADRSQGDGLKIEAVVKLTAKTGVEMEALTAAAVAALTIYDMAKSADPSMVITNLHLMEKKGGKSDFTFNGRDSHCE